MYPQANRCVHTGGPPQEAPHEPHRAQVTHAPHQVQDQRAGRRMLCTWHCAHACTLTSVDPRTLDSLSMRGLSTWVSAVKGNKETFFLTLPHPPQVLEKKRWIKGCKNQGASPKGFLCPLEWPAWYALAWMRVLLAICPPALPQVDIPGRQQEPTENFSIDDWTSECATAEPLRLEVWSIFRVAVGARCKRALSCMDHQTSSIDGSSVMSLFLLQSAPSAELGGVQPKNFCEPWSPTASAYPDQAPTCHALVRLQHRSQHPPAHDICFLNHDHHHLCGPLQWLGLGKESCKCVQRGCKVGQKGSKEALLTKAGPFPPNPTTHVACVVRNHSLKCASCGMCSA
eukprot:1161182-Pelagomonas_calceolata.AAC.11